MGFRNLIAALAVGLSVGAAAAASAQAPDVAKVHEGVLKGVVNGDVAAFKGIPYAAPPVGELRWRAPKAPAAWTGERSAAAYGPACMQMGRAFGGAGSQSEDCLTLNVWTPAKHAGGKLPVMVWIHGGGFTNGSGGTSFYDSTNFARDGVVAVTVNYRLGRLGWFAHPALTREGHGGPLANYGLMDQIAALKWVKANIAAFGGDPHNVTIYGESAGAISVNYLLISPMARGLFQKAIAESGFGRMQPPTLSAAEKLGDAYAKTQGINGDDAAAAKALRALSAEALSAPVNDLRSPASPVPVIDGVAIPQNIETGFAKGLQAHVPYLVGGNSYEASLFPDTRRNPEPTLAAAGSDRTAILALFGGGDPVKAATTLSTESMIIEPDRYLARQNAKAGVPTYVYYFSYVGSAQRATSPGAGHGSEITYVFGNLPTQPTVRGNVTFPPASAEDHKTSDAMHAYWVAFAKTGSPDSAGGVKWPAFSPSTDTLLEFGADGVNVREHFEQAQLDAVAAKQP
jgi:para-nitrobenzyl esterase